jgi:polysaccharide pyruvyl transferase WcaK-like protein
MAIKRYFNWNAIVSSLGRIKYQKMYYERFYSVYLPELGVHNHTFDEYDLVVIGSDEVFNFNQHTTYGFTPQLYGDVKNAKKVVSYAGSFGTTTIDIIDKFGVREILAETMSKMAAISVRDNNSFDVVKNLLGKEPSFNIDPVLMFDYQKYAKEPKEKDYIIVYSYPNRIKGKEEIKAIKRFAKEKGKKLISICFYFPWCDETVIPHPFEVLGYMKNADYVITDTFHGCVMSMKFNKQFVALVRDSNKQKMSSLLDQFGLGDRMCEEFGDLRDRMEKEIDYAPINEQIAKEAERSMNYLKSCTE